MSRVAISMRAGLVLLLALTPALPGPLTSARDGDARTRALRSRGGSETTEKAVTAALAWLAAHQERAGYWDADGFHKSAECDCDGVGGGWHGEPVPCSFDREVTGLAALAFLASGARPDQGEHKETVRRALDWLAADVTAGTLFACAYATQALAEAHDLTGDELWLPAVQRGVAHMVECRHPHGGWRYFAGSTMASGVPTTTAVVSALARAEQAGVAVDAAYKSDVIDWLDKLLERDNGRVKYTLDAEQLGYTPTTTNAASALLMLTLLGVPASDTRCKLMMGALADQKPKWSIRFRRMKVNGVMRDVQIGYLQHYYWHHGTEALATIGGSAWTSWNGAVKKALLSHQRKDGHVAGSWDPVGTYGKVGGRVYSTALCAMMLTAYYRY